MLTNGFKHMLPQKYRRPGRRQGRKLVHLDGVSYGTQGVMRYLASPLVISAAITTIFCAVAQTLLHPADPTALEFIKNLGFDSASTFFVAAPLYYGFSREDGDIAIDKNSYAGNPSEAFDLADWYRHSAIMGWVLCVSMAVGASYIGKGVSESLWLTIFNYVYKYTLDVAMFALPYAAGTSYAAYKLNVGEWTATSPPTINVPKRNDQSLAAEAQPRLSRVPVSVAKQQLGQLAM